jgi:2-methylcitrate dehydratase PrpD
MVDIHIEHAIGSLERPMTREALEQKFSGQAASALPGDQIDRVMALCWEVESLDDVGELANAAAAKS